MMRALQEMQQKYNKKSRVGLCALSASRTGSCRQDEKRRFLLAVHKPHPAAKRIERYLLCSLRGLQRR